MPDSPTIPRLRLVSECSNEMSRRRFCALSGLTLIGAAAGCSSGVVSDDGGVTGFDAGGGDLSSTRSGSCNGPVNAGQASAIGAGQAMHFTDNSNYDLYVCRDAGGLYALTAICTHAGCTVSHSSSEFRCPCHGATFDLNGQNPTGPARSPLDHYALCVDGAGTIFVDYTAVVSASTRA